MIVAERKPIEELLDMVRDKEKILLVGCKGCVTVCNAGGRKEVGILAAILRLARRKEQNPLQVIELTLERQCDPEYIEQIDGQVQGRGRRALHGLFHRPPVHRRPLSGRIGVYPALNTNFLGGAREHGVWAEFCQACGDCRIHLFGGLCPIARCSKSLFNGPCGGSADGKCEIAKDVDCVWHLIVTKAMQQGWVDRLAAVAPLKGLVHQP